MEKLRPARRRSVPRLVLSAGLAFTLAFGPPVAYGGPPSLPSGGVVGAGSATITQTGPSSTLIVQQGQKAVINWHDFSIGAGASVTFQQPGSGAIILNRVIGPGASAIDGSLLANGQVWLLNGNGILFGQGSRIDVGGLLATTSDIRDGDFLAGRYGFDLASGNPAAAVVNRGSIKAATGGSVVLSAARVANDGVIEAKLGKVALGGASAFSVDFDGDNLLRYAITAPVSQTPKDADGKPASALVSNSGTLSAQGGTVLMTARAARNVVDNVINTTGMVEARAVSVQSGVVVLDGGDSGAVTVAGTIDTSGRDAGESGGKITLSGDRIAVVDGARLNASGDAGGGTILAGGNLKGAGPLPNARTVTAGEARIAADATGKGNGGTVVLYATGETKVAASISARGGARGGDGGTVETSGGDLRITASAHIDTSAARGATGLWRLDPVDVDVDAAYATSIVGALASTSVSVEASHDITVNAPVIYSSTNSLSFLAGHDLTFNATVRNDGAGSILAVGGWDGVSTGSTILTTPGAFGNNGGSILIGGTAAASDVSVGSRNGATRAAAYGLTVTALNGYAQFGYHGLLNANSVIAVNLTGDLGLNGGAVAGRFAQIGHGNYLGSQSNSGSIAVTASGTIQANAGNGTAAYALIGNGGIGNTGSQSGIIAARAGGDFTLAGVSSANQNVAQVGNNGNAIAGSVSLTAGGSFSLSTASMVRASGSGDALVIAAQGNFINQGGASLSAAGGGRWLVFSNNPTNNSPGGLVASPFYNRVFNFLTGSYTAVTSGGNRFVYALAPVATVTADSLTKTYGNANPGLTATVTGGLPGDALSGVASGTALLTTAATQSSGVGNYVITIAQGSLVSDFNYTLQLANGNLHIDPATLMAGLTGTVKKVYDGTDAATLAAGNYSLSGVVGSDDVTLNNPSAGFYDNKNAGTGKTVGVGGLALQGAAKDNYVLASPSVSAAIGVIDRAALIYVADPKSRAYGQNNPAFTGTVTGFVNGESLASATTGTLAFNSPAAAASNVGTYAINGSGLSAGNYNFAQAAGNASALTITAATLTYVADAKSRVYGQNNPAFTGTVTGFVNADTLASATTGSLVFASPATLASNAGSYVINGSGLTANNGNYNFVQAAGNANALTIKSATLTYVADAKSRVYGQNNPAFTGTVTGFVNGDSLVSATTGTLVFGSPATAASNVGTYAITGSGLSAVNYNFVQAGNTNALTVTAATLTYVADAKSRTYGQNNPTLTGTVSGFVNADTLASATTGSLLFASLAMPTSNVGSYAITGSGLTANNGNYNFAQAAGNVSALTVTSATLTYVADAKSRVYGQANPAFTGTVTGFVNADTLASATTGSLLFASPATPTSNVGSYAITGSGLTANSGNYNFAQAAGNASALTVTQATLTYVADTKSRVYGQNNPAFTGTVTGFVNGQSLASATTGTLTFSSPATAASNVGSYAISGSGLAANNGNYNFVQAAGNASAFTITAATLTYVADAKSRAYGQNNPAFTGTVTGFVNGDSLTSATTGILTFDSSATAASNVGSYAITGSGLSAGNYNFVQAAGNASALTVTQATLTYVADTKSRAYGEANPAFTGTVIGFVNADTLASATTGSLVFDSPATPASNVGTHAINGSGLGAVNYNFVQAAGNASALTVTAAALTYVADAKSRAYGQANPSFTGTVIGFVNGESLASATTGSLLFTSQATAASNVGSHAITGSGLAANNGNYNFVQAAGNASALTVTAATLTYVADMKSRTYGQNNPAFTGTVTGFVNADTLASATTGALVFDSAATAASNVGSYAITGSGLAANNGNYNFVQAAGNANALTITVATLTYVADAKSRAYGQVNPAFTGTVTGFVNGDTLVSATTGALAFGSPATAMSGIGSYAILGSGLGAGNYNFVQAAGNANAFTITAAMLTYAADAKSRAYGQANPLFTGTVTGFLNGDTLESATTGTLAFGSTATSGSNVGSYAITGSGLISANYGFAQAAGNTSALTINPAVLTAVLTGTVQKTYDGTDAAALAPANYSLSGVISGDAVSLNTPAGGVYDSKDAGNGKTVSVSGLALQGEAKDNYVLASAGISAMVGKIDPAAMTASLTGTVQKIYDGTASAVVAAANFLLSGVVSGDSVTLNIPAGALYDSKDAGTGKTVSVNGLSLQGAGKNNYALTSPNISGTVGKIDPAALAASLTGTVQKVYDGTVAAALTAANYGLSGVISGDDVALNAPVSGSYDNKNAGTGKTVSVGGVALQGADKGNYILASSTLSGAVGRIDAASLTASLTGTVQRTYDGTDAAALAAANYQLAGVVSGDGVTLNAPASGSFDNKNAGNGKTVSVSGVALQGADKDNYVLSLSNLSAAIGRIDPAAVMASLTGTVQKIYDGTVSAVLTAANYSLSGVISGDSVTVNTPVSGSFDNRNVGTGKTVSVSGLALQGAGSGNYVLSSASLSGAIGRIDAATLTASLTGTVQKVFDGTASAIVSAANFLLGGVVAGDSVALTIPATGLYDNNQAGTGKTVTVSGLALQGAASGNYMLASSSVSGAVGIITAAQVVDNSGIVEVLGNTYVSTTNVPVVAPILVLPPQPDAAAPDFSDATSDVTGDIDSSESVAVQMGQSLNGAAPPSSTSVLIQGLLRQFSPPPGGSAARSVPPHGQVYSSWGNEAFWQ